MRVQVMREEKAGLCTTEGCRFSSIVTVAVRYVVFVGSMTSETTWHCLECIAKINPSMDFDLQPLVEDKRIPPDRRMKRTSRNRELEIAEDIGGRRQPGSGNQPFAKGDVRKKGDFRVEAKECFGLEFKVHRTGLLDKIRAECSRGEHPAVVITFRDKATHQELESWAMVPYEVWEERMNAARKNR